MAEQPGNGTRKLAEYTKLALLVSIVAVIISVITSLAKDRLFVANDASSVRTDIQLLKEQQIEQNTEILRLQESVEKLSAAENALDRQMVIVNERQQRVLDKLKLR